MHDITQQITTLETLSYCCNSLNELNKYCLHKNVIKFWHVKGITSLIPGTYDLEITGSSNTYAFQKKLFILLQSLELHQEVQTHSK